MQDEPLHDDDTFGDDFDDFEEGGGNEDDFGDFDIGEDEDDEPQKAPSAAIPAVSSATHISAPNVDSLPHIPVPDLDQLDNRPDLVDSIKGYLEEVYTREGATSHGLSAEPSEINPTFLTDRSQSLWEQLTAPPPLQPPNWVKSRIRRLFLVSLGVPVDLDEILPASKQKKLVLPSTESTQPGNSSAESKNGSHGARQETEASSTSTSKSRRRGPPPPPEFDVNTARRLCLTTRAALANLADTELQLYVQQLEHLERQANVTHVYWLTQRDRALGDKEAFEEVIDNLVKHAKRIRK